MSHRVGRQSIVLDKPVYIISEGTVVGKKEGEGPLKEYFDMIVSDDKMGQKSWDLAEGVFQKTALEIALKKGNLKNHNINYILSGDLQNQCVATHYGLRETNIPFLGLYGACSTMVESISVGAMLIDGGCADKTACITSSHFCSAEKQYRTPLEYGGQRTPTAQWTATASGCAVLSKSGDGPIITSVTTGKIIDYGVKDSMNMGACMAPAAADIILQHMRDFHAKPEDYDKIITGDLGIVGQEILIDLLLQKDINIEKQHMDCGIEIYDGDTQDTHAGGSGCGCSAVVLSAYILRQIEKGIWKKVLFIPTGALLSKTSFNEGQSVPGVAHAVVLENSDYYRGQ